MYSGSDSTESQKYPQWALNPSNFQNMSNDQVDWAALAQQWIIMKEAGPPPIPGESPFSVNKKDMQEGGEAPMDVEDKDQEAWNPVPRPSGWNHPQAQSWGSWNNLIVPSNVVTPPGVMKPPLLPTPPPGTFNQFNAPPESSSDNAVFFGGKSAVPAGEYPPGYWANNKQMKQPQRRYNKINAPKVTAPAPPIISESSTTADSPLPPLDAAKRKQLPAWIREGLEKMERDKLKQQEKEREKKEREEYDLKLKENEKQKMEILKKTMKDQQRSKFESDGEESEEGNDEDRLRLKPVPQMTQEELMLQVRRMMTEVLLNVTNRQIDHICREERQRHLKKLKGSDQRTTAPSGANITTKLGLGVYGESSGSESEESDSQDVKGADSDSDLKESIKKKVCNFSKTEREIEDKLAEADRAKSFGGNHTKRPSSPDSNDNDSQVDARLQALVSVRRYEQTPPRRSSDSKPKRTSSTSSESNDRSRYKSSKNRSRTYSSSSSESRHKKSKSIRRSRRSRSYSRTPERKRKSWDKRKSRSRSDSGDRRTSRSYSRSSSSYSKSKRRSRSKDRKKSRSKERRRSRSRSFSRKSRRRSGSGSSGRNKRHRH